MRKEFNDTGLCVPGRHYMADISGKIGRILHLVEKGKYFTINRPRQYGKTTVLSLLAKELDQREDYLTIRISFEGMGDSPFRSEQDFCPSFLKIIARSFMFSRPELSQTFTDAAEKVRNFDELSQFVSDYVIRAGKHTVLLIDEVDKSSDNQIFLHFLGMLRNKYLLRNEEQDFTFQSVIMAGVHDVKTLKAKIRPHAERKYNSPWNIATDFTVDLSFSPAEIATMLEDYSRDKGIQPDIPAIAERLYYYTSGYPYLVSKLCKFIDEQIIPEREEKNWSVADTDAAFRMIVHEGYSTTLFDSLVKNLENSPELYEVVLNMVINGKTMSFAVSDPLINLGYLYGIFSGSDDGRCRIHNRIFEQRIYAYMMSKLSRTDYDMERLAEPVFIDNDTLNIRLILKRFQSFMKEHYSQKDQKFLEREGRLLFLSFLRPIINGKGFEFKEPNVSDERRMDIVITYKNRRYVLELKRWYGPKAHEEGLRQLSDYLDSYSLKEGFLLIYDFSKNKEYKEEEIVFADKRIFAARV